MSAQARSGSSTSLNRKMSGSIQSLNSDNISMHGSNIDLAMRHLFDQVKTITVDVLQLAKYSFYCLWLLYLSAKSSTLLNVHL